MGHSSPHWGRESLESFSIGTPCDWPNLLFHHTFSTEETWANLISRTSIRVQNFWVPFCCVTLVLGITWKVPIVFSTALPLLHMWWPIEWKCYFRLPAIRGYVQPYIIVERYIILIRKAEPIKQIEDIYSLWCGSKLLTSANPEKEQFGRRRNWALQSLQMNGGWNTACRG